jgi:hypothetical protein
MSRKNEFGQSKLEYAVVVIVLTIVVIVVLVVARPH